MQRKDISTGPFDCNREKPHTTFLLCGGSLFFEAQAAAQGAFYVDQESAHGKTEIPQLCGEGPEAYCFSVSLDTNQFRDDLPWLNTLFHVALIVAAQIIRSVAAGAYDAMEHKLSVITAIEDDVVRFQRIGHRPQGDNVFSVANERKHTSAESAEGKFISPFDGGFDNRVQIFKANFFTDHRQYRFYSLFYYR